MKRVSTYRGAVGLVLCCAVAFGACSPAPRPPDAQQDATNNDAVTLDQPPAADVAPDGVVDASIEDASNEDATPDAAVDDVFDAAPDVVSTPDVADVQDAPDVPDAPSAALWDMAEWDRGVWQ
ncbi:MAG: hypothetical protein JNK05_19145 [Myxococcales bacterium]|nr:hypothetical protein [Myxococcales bacterium]